MKKVILVLGALLTFTGCETSEDSSECASEDDRETMCEESFTAALESWSSCNEDHSSFAYLEVQAELNGYANDCLNKLECVTYNDLEECLYNDWKCLEDVSFVKVTDACWSTIL